MAYQDLHCFDEDTLRRFIVSTFIQEALLSTVIQILCMDVKFEA